MVVWVVEVGLEGRGFDSILAGGEELPVPLGLASPESKRLQANKTNPEKSKAPMMSENAENLILMRLPLWSLQYGFGLIPNSLDRGDDLSFYDLGDIRFRKDLGGLILV